MRLVGPIGRIASVHAGSTSWLRQRVNESVGNLVRMCSITDSASPLRVATHERLLRH
jgi:hypothetical protein